MHTAKTIHAIAINGTSAPPGFRRACRKDAPRCICVKHYVAH
jgi:hypothetical protein